MSMLRRLALAAALSCALLPARAADAVHVEQLTWTELRARVTAGTTTVIIPVGGTEQSGPHLVLGKHNVRVHALAGRIAAELGNAVVAPVLAYVPEGTIRPPQAHMRFAGTISIPEAAFEAVIESAARSFRQHGFRDVVLLGDHGGYQQSLQRVAARLNHEWANDPSCRVHALAEYYRVTQTAYVEALRARGLTEAEIGSHAGLADTALALAVDPSLVRAERLADAARGGVAVGVHGDPRRATVELGQLGTRLIVESSVAAIRAAVRSH